MSGKRPADRQRRQYTDTSTASSPAASQADSTDSRRNSAATSPIELRQQIDFQFLNFSHPSEAKTTRTRKAVRSHVTKQQHQRENAAAAARRAARSQEELTLRQREPVVASASSSVGDVSRAETPEASPSPSISPINAPQRRLDPSEIYPEEWHPYIGRIMEHYTTNLAVDTPDLDNPDEPGLLRTRFLPFVMSDPASMHAVMLVAASHLGRVQGTRHAIDLLELRGMAIREINNALEDTVRATSDQLIAAVAEMAAYEALFGDRSIFNTHMTGLLRLVSMRGGLPALGLDGLLERILLWIDVNASFVTRSHIYFDKAAFPTSAVHPAPDPARFSGGLV